MKKWQYREQVTELNDENALLKAHIKDLEKLINDQQSAIIKRDQTIIKRDQTINELRITIKTITNL